jgi:HAD superfamily hydrolase (TIGR01509 family)
MEIENRMLQALIFDFDGLIIDTEWTEFQAWQEMCQQHGVELTLETWLPCIGRGATTRVFDPYDYLETQAGKTLVRKEVEAWCRRRNLELIDGQPLLPGVRELIVEARARGLRLAVASSSSRRWVAGHLARLELLAYFDTLVCGDEVEHTKPYPDVYQGALARIGVDARQAVAFEDSLNGMLAARRAGLFCVVVPGALTQYLTFGEVDLRLNSLADITLDTLEHHLSGRRETGRDGERA